MVENVGGCRKKQEELLESFLAGGERAALSIELNNHLESCAACRNYWKALAAVRFGFPEDSMYSSFLREKTMRRLASHERAASIAWLPLIILAALISLSLYVVLPAWLLSRLFSHWTSSLSLACGAAFGTMLLVGMMVTAAAAVSLIEQGYIRFDNRREYVRKTE